MNAAFWRGKKVFLTGHTGFKGAWMSLWLQELGADLTGYSLPPPTTPNLFELASVADGMHSMTGDIRDAARLQKAVASACPDIVIHMAAQPLVRYSYAQPVETYSTNVMGLIHLLEAARTAPGIRAFINITSDKCYENRGLAKGFSEDDPLGGYDPYSSSKACAELVTAAYRSSYFKSGQGETGSMSVATARAGNVIGGGDWGQDRLIPDTIRAIDCKHPVMIRNPEAVRPWQHVLEPLSGYLSLAEKLCTEGQAYAEAWNFGPDASDAQPVGWLVSQLTQAWGDGASWIADDALHPHEAAMLKLDCSKTALRLGWHPRWNIEIAVSKTIDWYKAYSQRANMREITLSQIHAYERSKEKIHG